MFNNAQFASTEGEFTYFSRRIINLIYFDPAINTDRQISSIINIGMYEIL